MGWNFVGHCLITYVLRHGLTVNSPCALLASGNRIRLKIHDFHPVNACNQYMTSPVSSSRCVHLPFSLGHSSRKARDFKSQIKHTKTVTTSTLNQIATVQMGLYIRYTLLSMELARSTGTLLSRNLESSPTQITYPDRMLAVSRH